MQAEKFTNHAVADTLDSSDAFEGPEKTLRIYFATAPPKTDPDSKQPKGLLEVPRSEWEAMLDLVKCKVLSVLAHPNVHAYVLSESSLFVYRDHIILKTCGTTTLLQGLGAIISIVERFQNITLINPEVVAAFYSRRSYFNPDKQPHPHRCWDDEVAQLKTVFKGASVASNFGIKGDERWHLFTHRGFQEHFASPCLQSLSGGWLELIMTGLDEDSASRFHLEHGERQGLEDSVVSLDSMVSISSSVGADPDDEDPGHQRGNVMTHNTRIDQLFNTNDQCIDSFAFTPCGYSCNGLLKDGDYFTIHVTPEKGSSYASFETSVESPSDIEAGLTHQQLVTRVLEIFEPEKVTLVICLPQKKHLVDVDTLLGGKYSCTSEAELDVGNAGVIQLSLEKR